MPWNNSCDGAAKMKWTTPTSYYTVRFPGAIDAKYWNDRLWVNAELAPPSDSKGKDNQNWIAVMDAYGGKALRDGFSQAGYIAARVAVNAMLSIKNPDDINRNTVTAAIQNMEAVWIPISCACRGTGAVRRRPSTIPIHGDAHRDHPRRQVEECGRLHRRCRSRPRQHRGFGEEAGNKDQRSGSSELARSQQALPPRRVARRIVSLADAPM